MMLQILSGKGTVQIMPLRKLGGKFHFFLEFCTRKQSKTYIFMGPDFIIIGISMNADMPGSAADLTSPSSIGSVFIGEDSGAGVGSSHRSVASRVEATPLALLPHMYVQTMSSPLSPSCVPQPPYEQLKINN